MTRYIKISERTRVRRAKCGTRQPCDECGFETKDLYWVNAKGKPITMPLCRDCFEKSVQRLVRDMEQRITERLRDDDV